MFWSFAVATSMNPAARTMVSKNADSKKGEDRTGYPTNVDMQLAESAHTTDLFPARPPFSILRLVTNNESIRRKVSLKAALSNQGLGGIL